MMLHRIKYSTLYSFFHTTDQNTIKEEEQKIVCVYIITICCLATIRIETEKFSIIIENIVI